MNSEVLIKFKGDTADAQTKTDKMAKSVGDLTQSFLLANIAAEAFTYALGVIKSNLDDAITRVDTLNNFPRVMSNLNISAEDSAAVIEDLSERLKGLPTTINDAANSVQRLTSKNGDIKKSEEYFLAMNNAILAGGASAQTQSSAIEQLSQAYAKGKPDMMEWRTIMTAMPAQLKQVAMAMGYVDADALGEALRNGEVSMDLFMDTLVQLNQEGQNGFLSLEEQARNATGGIRTNITNMKTAIVRGVADIITSLDGALEPFGGISGVLTSIGKVAEEVFSGIGEVIKDIAPDLIEFGKEIFPVIKSAIDDLMPVFKKLVSTLLPALKKVIEKLMPTLKKMMEKIMPAIVKIIDSLIPLLPPLIDFIGAALDMTLQLIEPLIEILSVILPPIVDILSTLLQVILPPLTYGMEQFGESVKTSFKFVKDVVKGIIEWFGKIVNFIKDNWQSILLLIVNPFAGAFKLIYDNFDGFREAVDNVVKTVKEAFQKAWDKIKEGAQNVWNGITGIFKGFADFFGDILSGAWQKVKDLFSAGGNIFVSIVDGVLNVFKDVVNGLIDGINNVISIPFEGINAALRGIKNINIFGKKPFAGIIDTIDIPRIPHLNVGTNVVPEDMIAMIHKDEAVIPAKFNPYANPNANTIGMFNSPIKQTIIVNANFKQNSLGQTVRDIKTFSGGAKNDFNYGM